MRRLIALLACVVATLMVAWSGVDAQAVGSAQESETGLPKQLQLPKELQLPKGVQLPGPDAPLDDRGWRPWQITLLDPPNPFLDPRLLDENLTLAKALEKLKLIQRIHEPERALVSLQAEILDLDLRCPTDPAACTRRGELRVVEAILEIGNNAAPDCDPAAKAFQPHHESPTPPAAEARAFDLACMGSVLPRQLATAPEPAPPAIMQVGGGAGAAQGALTAIGLIEARGIPFCGALLRNDRTFVTARHCYHALYNRLQDGTVTIRPVSGKGGPWRVARAVVAAPISTTDSVENDWIRLRIDTTDEIGAAEVTMVPAPKAGAVTLIGHFAPYRHASGSVETDNEWRRALRFPRDGMCVAVTASPRCVRLLCQTVKGFSGTPVFQVDPARPDAPLHVVGLISRPQQISSGCGIAPAFYTLAVPASAIR